MWGVEAGGPRGRLGALPVGSRPALCISLRRAGRPGMKAWSLGARLPQAAPAPTPACARGHLGRLAGRLTPPALPHACGPP